MVVPLQIHPQSDLDKVLKGGEIIVNGLSFLKGSKETKEVDSGHIESICVKNKLNEKITFKIASTDIGDTGISKELVIQKDGKECIFKLQKGIYTYEIVLANKEIYKKGEYRFSEETTITIKNE